MKGCRPFSPGAVASITLLIAVHAVGAHQLVVDGESVVVRTGDATLLRYHYGYVPPFKPYLKELFTPAGINVLLDAPADHPHHHGLMFAYAVNKVDFWGEAPTQPGGHFESSPGWQRHRPFDDVDVLRPEANPWARFAESVGWFFQPRSELLLNEHRTITIGRFGKPQATLLTWQSKLSAPKGKAFVVLSGSHYHGLGLRFIRSMDATGEFRNPDSDPGVIFRGEERLTRSKWCAYTAQVDGKTVTVAMFDDPKNPRHPATWFTMAKPFAYMSATLRLHEETLTVRAGKDLTLRYGVALWDGRPEMEQINDTYGTWMAIGQFFTLD